MKKLYTLLTIVSISFTTYAQQGLGVGNTDPQEMLDVSGAIRIGNDVISSPVNPGTIRWNTTTSQFEGWDGTQWVVFGGSTAPAYTGSIFRWAVWSTYGQASSWYAGNAAGVFGGITPSTWSDGNGLAAQMSSDKQVLLSLFSKRAYGGNNALVWADEWYSNSSTNGKFAGALFRIENTTGAAINWNVSWYATGYESWSERASVTVNGVNEFTSTGSVYPSTVHSRSLSIPANRTSTIIFIAASSPANPTRSTFLAFTSNSLALPAGLKYVDDMDTAPNGWAY